MIRKTMTILAIVALGSIAPAQDDPAAGSKNLDGVWNDPEFQKRFLGSYGFAPELEPSVTQEEREAMEEILQLLQDGNTAVALGKLKEVTTDTSSAVFDFTAGNLLFQEERYDEAAGHYERALLKFPSFRRAHKNLGLIRIRQDRYDEAIESFARVIELGAVDGQVFGLLGYAFSATEQWISAESAYRNALMLDPKTLDWKLGLTQAVLRQGKYAEAAALAGDLIAGDPDRADFWLLQANAYIGLEKPRMAAQNFEMVGRMGQANAASLKVLGDIYVNEEMFDLAANAYARSIDADPGKPVEDRLRSVEVLAQRGAMSQAKLLLAKVKSTYARSMGDDDKKRLLKLESRIAMAEGGGDDAVAVLEEIVALDPLDGEALILLGGHYARNGDQERAVFYYERASSLEEHEAEAKLRHAQLLVDQGRYADAVPLLKRAQEIDPRDDVARFLEQVERISKRG